MDEVDGTETIESTASTGIGPATADVDPDFWGPEGTEVFSHQYIDDAILQELEDAWPDLPETLVMSGVVRRKAGMCASTLLDGVLEMLDEEYGNPDAFSEAYTKPTEMMVKAAEVFVHVVMSEYDVWSCEEVTTRSIDVVQWCKHNAAEMLEGK